MKYLIKLKFYLLPGCKLVTNTGLFSIVSLPNLQFLSINGLEKITDEVFNTIIPNLRDLDCRSCPNLGNAGLTRVVKYSEKIEYIDMSDCKGVSNIFLKAAIEEMLKRKNTVLKLRVSYTGIKYDEDHLVCNDCLNFGNGVLARVVKYSEKIDLIDMSVCNFNIFKSAIKPAIEAAIKRENTVVLRFRVQNTDIKYDEDHEDTAPYSIDLYSKDQLHLIWR